MNAAPGIKKEMSLLLKELHLPTVRQCYEDVAREAQRESLSYETYLLEVVRRETEVRCQKRIERLLRASRLPLEKTLSVFDMKRLPQTVRHRVNSLLEGHYLDKKENVLAFGNPGSGKSHLLCAIGHEMICRYGRRVYFTPCSLLVQALLIAKRDLKLSRLLKKLSKFEAIIIDDIGYVQQDRNEMEVLFTLLADRYERGSVMITSNLAFSHWEKIFKDPMTTAAAIDRLVHHSTILELNIPSYRFEKAKTSQVSEQASAGKKQGSTTKGKNVAKKNA
jgi:DNA replication protein DnaC